MKNRDLTFVIKVRNAAVAALKQLRGDMASVGKDSAEAAKRVAAAGTEMDQLGRKASTAAKAVKSATASNVKSVGDEIGAQKNLQKELDNTAKARERASKAPPPPPTDRTGGSRALAARQTEQMRNMNGGSAPSPGASKAMAAEAAKLRAALYPATAAYDALMAKQKSYDALLKAGAITQTEHRASLAFTKRAIEALDQATGKAGHGMKVNSLAIRESLVLMREAARGDTTRMAGSFSILAQSFGLVEKAAVAIMSPVGMVATAIVAALGIAAAGAASAASRMDKLGNMTRLTGNYAGLTAQNFEDMADRIGHATKTSAASNQELISSLAMTNQFTLDQIAGLVDAGDRFARATGQEATKVIEDWSKMSEGPGKFAMEFSKQYSGVIAPLQARQIQDLELRGRKEEALSLLIKTLHDGMVDKTKESTNKIGRAWDGMIEGISNGWLNFTRLFEDSSTDQVIAAKQRQIDAYTETGHGDSPLVKRLQAELAQLKANKTAEATRAAADATTQRRQREQREARDTILGVGGQDPTLEAQQIAALDHAIQVGDKNDPVIKDAIRRREAIVKQIHRNNSRYDARDERAAERHVALSPRTIIEQAGGNYTSGFRTDARQKELYLEAVAKYGPNQHQAAKPKSMGGPGSSHQSDKAVDWTGGPSPEEMKKKFYAEGYRGLYAKTELNGSHHIQWTNKIASAESEAARERESAATEHARKVLEAQKFASNMVLTLQDQVAEASMLPDEAARYAEKQKLINMYALNGVELDKTAKDLLGGQIDDLLTKKNIAGAVNTARMHNLDIEKQNYVAAQSRLGLSYDEQNVEDALNANKLAFLSKFDTKEEGLKHLTDAKFLAEQKTLEVLIRQSNQIDHQKVAAQQLMELRVAQYNALLDNQGAGMVGYDKERFGQLNSKRAELASQQHLDVSAPKPEDAALWADINDKVRQYGVVLDEAHQRQLQLAGDMSFGLRDGLSRWAEQARNVSGAISDLVGTTMNGLTDMLTTFVTTGKLGFKDFVRSAMADISKLIVKMLVLKAIEAAMNFVLPGSGSIISGVAKAGVRHGGGMAGTGGSSRSVNPALFAGAMRFHSGGMGWQANMSRAAMGLKKGEVPIIALENERILNPAETRAYNSGGARGATGAARMGGVSVRGGDTNLTLSPQVMLQMSGGPGSNNQGGMAPDQMKAISKSMEDDMRIFMAQWVANEQRPGGKLARK